MGDPFDVLNFNHLSINSQLFDGILGSLRKLIALRSPHPQNFNLFHYIYLLKSLMVIHPIIG
jgi:hypothetical protein